MDCHTENSSHKNTVHPPKHKDSYCTLCDPNIGQNKVVGIAAGLFRLTTLLSGANSVMTKPAWSWVYQRLSESYSGSLTMFVSLKLLSEFSLSESRSWFSTFDETSDWTFSEQFRICVLTPVF